MKVWIVTTDKRSCVSARVWGVYNSAEKAEKRKMELSEEIINSLPKNGERHYIGVEIEEHEVK